MDRLAEIRESEAPVAIAAVYDDIKKATGIPQVNLIWRHLATRPEMLAWAWDVVRPVYLDGRLADAIAALDISLDGWDMQPNWQPIWANLDAADSVVLQEVLAFYNRGNAANLVGLTTLVRAAGSTLPQRPPGQAAPQPSETPASGVEIPPLPKPDTIAPEVFKLVQDLAVRQGGAALGVTPSLYLHLALWPDAMTAAHARVKPLLATPEWQRRFDRLVASAGVAGDRLAATLDSAVTAPPEAVRAPFIRTIERFVGATIPEMVLIGRLLAGRIGSAPAR